MGVGSAWLTVDLHVDRGLRLPLPIPGHALVGAGVVRASFVEREGAGALIGGRGRDVWPVLLDSVPTGAKPLDFGGGAHD